MLLSFIIPAYNCSRYIDCCLESLFAQGLDKDDYEIVVVNDGSTDDTEEKVKRYCDENENIRLISTPNRGVGKARNEGIRFAKGRYVHFMDADDRLLPDGMRILFDNYVVPENFPDVVSFYSHTVDRYYDAEKWDTIGPHAALFKGTLAEGADARGVGNSVWVQLISRDLILNSKLEFSDHKIGEDMLFMLHLHCIEDATVLATNLNIYRYHVREESAMNATNKEHVLAVFDSLTDLSDRLKELRASSSLPAFVVDPHIDICKRWAFTRLSSAPLTCDEIRMCLNQANKKGLFGNGSDRSSLNRFIYFVSRHPILFYMFSAGYRKIFLPFVKPYLKRN